MLFFTILGIFIVNIVIIFIIGCIFYCITRRLYKLNEFIILYLASFVIITVLYQSIDEANQYLLKDNTTVSSNIVSDNSVLDTSIR